MVSQKGKPLQRSRPGPPNPGLPCPGAGSGPLVAAGQMGKWGVWGLEGSGWESRGIMEPWMDHQKQLIVWVKRW